VQHAGNGTGCPAKILPSKRGGSKLITIYVSSYVITCVGTDVYTCTRYVVLYELHYYYKINFLYIIILFTRAVRLRFELIRAGDSSYAHDVH